MNRLFWLLLLPAWVIFGVAIASRVLGGTKAEQRAPMEVRAALLRFHVADTASEVTMVWTLGLPDSIVVTLLADGQTRTFVGRPDTAAVAP